MCNLSWDGVRRTGVKASLLMASALAALALSGCSASDSTEALARQPRSSVAPATDPSPHTTKHLGFVVSRTAVPHGYRVVLAPAEHRPDDSWTVIPGRATTTYLVPRSMVPTASLLSGVIQLATSGRRVTGVAIIGG
jgi:hypothetical protein